jgi:hypothetical protein
MLRRIIPFALTALIAVLLLVAIQSKPSSGSTVQQEDCETFQETGFTICGKFQAYWHEHGGLPIFGYIISTEFEEESDLDGQLYTVQYFERAEFELHPENQPPYDVLLAQIGKCYSQDRYPGGAPRVEGNTFYGPKPVKLVSDLNYDLFPKDVGDFQIFASYPNTRTQSIFTFAPTESSSLFSTRFETVDSPDTVKSFYKGLAEKQGWKKVDPNWDISADYYFGDYGQKDVYAYLLSFNAAKDDRKNLTSASVWVEEGVPILLGARDVRMEESGGFDSRYVTLTYTTDYIRDEVIAFHREILPKDGWHFRGYSHKTLVFGRQYKTGVRVSMWVSIDRSCTDRPRVEVTYFQGCCS